MDELGNKLNSAALISKSSPIVCENCSGKTFTESVLLRRIPGLLIGEKQDAVIPIPVFTCRKCGHVNKEFIPKILPEEKPFPSSGTSIIETEE